MNKTLLILNALILVVNFFLSLSSTNSQVSVLESTARIGFAGGSRIGPSVAGGRIPFLRMVHSLEGSVPRERLDQLTVEQLRGLEAAMARYAARVDRAVTDVLVRGNDGVPPRRQFEECGRDARQELENDVRSAVKEESLVRPIATAIVNHAR